MSAQNYVCGPCELHVGTGASGALEFLGFSENGLRHTTELYHEDIHNDLSGPQMPYDVQQMGATGLITGMLNTWDDGILRKFVTKPMGGGLTSSTLAIASGGMGSLMRLEQKGSRVLVYPQYATKSVFAVSGQDMKPKNHPTCYLVQALDRDPMGIRYERCHLIIRSIPVLVGAVWTLHDYDVTGKPAAVVLP